MCKLKIRSARIAYFTIIVHSGGLNGSDGHSVYTPVPADISSLIDKYQQRKEQERRECTIHV
ncbi:hypothetical protein MSG28_011309 [Choristoneura fumiferana]|uniref:Uncharacterized protein n=1 Tax=Choristoneura fumiferana TaxID=7141 RepID=A0ACC0KRV2_CHOFU|nr:hypothetical protein MSG28_011309 [Choristoneura fumiferana]